MATTGDKGNPLYANSEDMKGPEQMSAISAWAATHIGETVDTIGDLPTTGDWAGQHVFVTSIGDFVWDGSTWKQLSIQVGKVTRATSGTMPSTPSTATVVAWSSAVIGGSAFWTSGTHMILPIGGIWEVSGWITGSGTDAGLVRAAIALNGTVIRDSSDNVVGLSGLTDPFCHPHTTIPANATDYVELVYSSSVTGGSLAAGATMTAKYLGPSY